MSHPRLLMLLTIVLLAGKAEARPGRPMNGDSLPPVRAVRLHEPVTLDGALTESVWRDTEPIRWFVQSYPNENTAPSESTWAWVAYDDDALYIAARMWDAHPDSIIASLVRRDLWVTSDRVVVYLDSYHDHRNGSFFSISAAGVLWDGVLYSDVGSDDSWDGVWDGRVRRGGDPADRAAGADPVGWTCEMRIPFSQLRFRPGADQVWGFNLRRRLERGSELDELAYRPRNGSGFVSRFPHLVGLEFDGRGRRIEVSPYSTGKAEYLAHLPGDPFHDGSRYTPGVGGDLRMSVGNNLTLNAAVNPDFGQVEVDPAVVNLSDVETSYEEKRPFFTDNSRVFEFGTEGANRYWGFGWPGVNFLYTRRIGRTPQGAVPYGADYADLPMATRILGAAKLAGKLAPSLHFGTMHALTGREEADYELGGLRDRTVVEPLTYYGVATGLKEFHGGYNGLGAMTTLVQRRLDDTGMDGLVNRQGLVTALDGWHFLDAKKMWVLSGWTAMTRVAGTPERMVALQRNPRHYLQRPDVSYLGVDSSATSLTGFGGRVSLNKQDGNLISNSSIGVLSPGFEVNDMGYQSRADMLLGHTGLQYRFEHPNRIWHDALTAVVTFHGFDFGGDYTDAGYWQGNTVTFANDWTIDTELMYVPPTTNVRRSRGGPRMLEHEGGYGTVTFSTADRRRLVFSFYGTRNWTPAAGHGTDIYEIKPALEWKPASNLSLQVGPDVQRVIEDAQYVRRVDAPGEVPADFGDSRYVFARMDQTTVAAEIRLNISFTPRLSLQTYLQPLVSAARFSDFKELARAGSYDFEHYGALYDPATATVSPAGGTPFALHDPSFNARSLRGNAVLRWEYRPGSVLFFVWTQSRNDAEAIGDLQLRHSTRRLFDAEADDVFLVKATYHLDL
jgi:hypothetical protein